jgi:putative DNA primase/helicase
MNRDDLRDYEAQERASRNGNCPDAEEVVTFIRASGITPANVRWAWKGWMPLAMLTLLVGLPGRGKTILAEQLAADVSQGCLDGDLFGEPSNVLIASYEDAIAETLVPRLMAAEADRDRIEFIACKQVGQVLDLTRHLPEIERRAEQWQVKLIVIDPLVAGLPRDSVNSYRDQDVRSVLAPLAALAAARGLSVLATMHFSKSAVSALLGAGGSVGFVAAARSILVFGVDPRDKRGAEGPARVVAHAKCNVGRLQRSRELLLTEAVLDPFGDEPIITARMELGEQCGVVADDLVTDGSQQLSERAKAQRFLRELLADGPHRATEVYELGENADISVRTLKRAKKELEVKSERRTTDDKTEWWWVMPEEGPQDGDSAEDAEEDE